MANRGWNEQCHYRTLFPIVKGVQNMADKPANMPEHFSVYTVFPTSLFFRRDLTDSDKMLYGLLSCMADLYGYAFPKNSTLRKYLGKPGKPVSEDTVSRRLKALEDAGAIRIEGGKGGRGIRKIYITGVDFLNLRKFAEVEGSNLRKSAEVHNIDNNNINKNNKKAKNSEKEIREWIDGWATSLGYEMGLTTKLISEFNGFADNRKAKGKPFLTIRAVSLQANRLVNFVGTGLSPTETVARMRYMLIESCTHNWEKVVQIDQRTELDFWRWANLEYGLTPPETAAPEYF